MADTVLAQLSALKTAPIGALKQKWRDLFEKEPPPYNRRFLESRLAYRVQELAYGGLKPETIERLDALANELEGNQSIRRRQPQTRPIAGTRLIREWKGVEHCITVRIAVGHREGDHWHPLERAGVLWPQEPARVVMAKEMLPIKRKLRCAIYTRKSSEEGLEQEFNSLDAQREACEAYVASQRAEGWLLLGDQYDDGGFSGGTLERPALKRLMADIEARRVDIVVVYKIDRLSRSLMDFARLVEVFERTNVTFVSVTQSFNTTTSMGRLTLNVLLSFAQFEREVIGERIRDKFAASRKKGMWMGGFVPLGYAVKDRKLVINEAEAATVRSIFRRFAKIGSATKLAQELAAEDVRNRYGKLIDKGAIYKLLSNRVYVGEAVHKGTAYPGEHQAIIDRALWDKIHGILKQSPRKRASHHRARAPAPLKGLIFGPGGVPMTPSHTRKRGRLYHYYVATSVLRSGIVNTCPIRRIPAIEIEAAVVGQIKIMVQTPEIVVATWRAAKSHIKDLTERQVREHLHSFEEIWSELFPAEQTRIVQLLVARVDVTPTGADITLRTDGLATLMQDLRPSAQHREEAA